MNKKRMLTVLGGTRLLPYELDFSGLADGDLPALWEASDWRIVSGVAYPVLTFGSNLVVNGDFETASPGDNWTSTTGASITQEADHGGNVGEVTRGSSAYRTVSQTVDTTTVKNNFAVLDGVAKNITSTHTGFGSGSDSYLMTDSTADYGAFGGSSVITANSTIVGIGVVGASGAVTRIDDINLRTVVSSKYFQTAGFKNYDVDIKAYFTSTNFGKAFGIVLGLDSQTAPQNYVVFYYENTILKALKNINGTITSLYSKSCGLFEAASYLRLIKRGGIIDFIFGGNTLNKRYFAGSSFLVNDATFVNNVKHGAFSLSDNNGINKISVSKSISPALLNGSATSMFSFVSQANLWETSGTDDWLGRPVLADDGTNWIAIYRSGTSHTAGGSFHIRFSADDGANWTAEDTFTDTNPVTGAPFIATAPATNVTDSIIMVSPNGTLLIHAYEAGAGTKQYSSTNSGASWTDDGYINTDSTLIGGQDYVIKGTTIYVPFIVNPSGTDWTLALYKSVDNGANWTKVSDIDTAVDCNEPGIIDTTSGFLVIMRDSDETTTHKYTSSDDGLTWSARTDVEDLMVLQRPRMKKYLNGILLYGRQYIGNGTYNHPIVHYSPDNGNTWTRHFLPESATDYVDTGYCDLLQQTAGNFYMLNYGGTTTAAVVRQCIFGVT